jgi:predicted RNase H-like nuclease (RuvC/YqgF family)
MFNIDKKYNSDILLYCELNKIKNVNSFVTQCFKQGFDIKKYGLLGNSLNDGEKDLKTGGIDEKHVIKEVIVEKRVEVPVEVIKEIEKIVEVPVEIIKEIEKIVEVPVDRIIEKEFIKEVIKEVPVEKIVTKIEYICDKTTEDELGGIIAKLKNEMSKKDEKLDELRHNLDELLDKPQIEIIKEVEIIKEIPVEIIKEVEVIKEIEKPNDKVNLLQQTIQNLTSEVRELKKKNEELENKLNDQPRQSGEIPAKFFGGSNLKL